MRSKKILINSIFGLAGYLVFMLSNLITRSVFVNQLGLSMGGVDTTFKNFLQVLSLAELGLSTGLIYKLYKPIEEKDNKAIKKVLNFYKQAYSVIALIFMGGAIVLSVIVTFFVTDTGKTPLYLSFLFILYAGDTVASYLFANRKALIVADQNNYLVNRNDAFVSIITLVTQVTLLYLTKSFIVFATVKIICRILGAYLIGRKFNKLYPEIAADKSKESISGEERKDLLKNMSAMLCHRIGGVSVTATASAIISAFLGTVLAGVYGNYTLITTTLLTLVTQIFHGITASFGNVMAVETEETVYKKFNQIYFFNYLIFSFATVSVAVLIQPFMHLWIGETDSRAFLDYSTVVLLLVYFFLFGMRRSILITKDSAGLYRPDRYFALVEAVLNIALSIVLVSYFKTIDSVILANIISIVLIPFWTQPILVYKQILHRNPIVYYLRYVVYAALTFVMTLLTLWVSNTFVTVENVILEIILKGIICLIIPNVVNFIIFFKTAEMQGMIKMIKGILVKK
jgi:O-antigen/teichoic acid export membrane protein